MVNAELESKMKQKALALKLSNLQITKLRLAEIVPKFMLKQKLLTFTRWRFKVDLIPECPREPESSITIRTRSQTSQNESKNLKMQLAKFEVIEKEKDILEEDYQNSLAFSEDLIIQL